MRSFIKIAALFFILSPSFCLGAVVPDYVAICNTRPTLRIYDGYSARSWLRDEVRALQRRMNVIHDFNLVVDGYFGPGTQGAGEFFLTFSSIWYSCLFSLTDLQSRRFNEVSALQMTVSLDLSRGGNSATRRHPHHLRVLKKVPGYSTKCQQMPISSRAAL